MSFFFEPLERFGILRTHMVRARASPRSVCCKAFSIGSLGGIGSPPWPVGGHPLDVRPRNFSDDAISTLQRFATVVEELIQGRVARTRTGVVS